MVKHAKIVNPIFVPMNFSWFFAKRIAWSAASGYHLSRSIIRIGQAAVAIGIIVALITLSTGIGARREIKQKLADFNGHITIRPYNSNLSLNSDTISLPQAYYPKFPLDKIEHIQAIATKSGIIRTPDSFEGVLLKGVDGHFDKERFQQFLRKGNVPDYGAEISEKVLVSENIANQFYLDIDSSFVMVFVDEKNTQRKPIYRNFTVAGIYVTDVKQFDDLYVIADLRQVQKINRWDANQVGGFELFVEDIEQDLQVAKEEVNQIIGYDLLAEAATDTFSDINEWVAVFDMNIMVILGIMLIVVIINMVMILLILILERTPSIGILKTLGATHWQVMQVFAYYAIFIMLPGLLIGNFIALALLGIQMQWSVIQLPPENYYISTAPVYLTPFMVIAVNVMSIFISFLVLLLCALFTVRITPVKALKMG